MEFPAHGLTFKCFIHRHHHSVKRIVPLLIASGLLGEVALDGSFKMQEWFHRSWFCLENYIQHAEVNCL